MSKKHRKSSRTAQVRAMRTDSTPISHVGPFSVSRDAKAEAYDNRAGRREQARRERRKGQTMKCRNCEDCGCYLCCSQCNYDRHLCKGCGRNVGHARTVCDECFNDGRADTENLGEALLIELRRQTNQ